MPVQTVTAAARPWIRPVPFLPSCTGSGTGSGNLQSRSAQKRFAAWWIFATSKTIYGQIFKDEGYFSSIDPLARIKVAENTWDLGEYLLELYDAGVFVLPRTAVQKRLVYFAPCHQREQEIGTPYAKLVDRITGSRLEIIDGRFYCCGMAGIMGFKKEFRENSVQMGRPLFEKIRELDPEVLVTDCLSCRLQFQQHLPYPVRHPIEILREVLK